MNIKKNFLFYLSLIFFSTSLLNAEQIVYINIEKIMKESKAGKQIIEKITKSNETNINKFKKIEENLRSQEKDLLAKKNVISEDEFQKFASLRDQELELHFQHLKIETTEE